MNCRPRFEKKYRDRPSPAYSAQECPGMIKTGNDGNLYVSKVNVRGIYQWKRYHGADPYTARPTLKKRRVSRKKRKVSRKVSRKKRKVSRKISRKKRKVSRKVSRKKRKVRRKVSRKKRKVRRVSRKRRRVSRR